MSDYPVDRDLYRTAATPVNPMPERAGVVEWPTLTLTGCTPQRRPRMTGAKLYIGDGSDPENWTEVTGTAETDAHGYTVVSMDPEHIAAFKVDWDAAVSDPGAYWPGQLVAEPHPIAAHQARAEAKAQRVAEDDECFHDFERERCNLCGAEQETFTVEDVLAMPRHDLTDDIPELPRSALRTWEGWGG